MIRPTKYIICRTIKLAILLAFLVFNSFWGNTQKFEIENKFHIKQDDKSIVFRVLDTDDSQLKKYNPNKNYYWFKSQKVLVTQGGSSGSLLDGIYESFYKNNQLAEKGLFKKGLKHGVWKHWAPNGILMRQENWSKGTQTGKQLYYSQEGIIQKTIVYKNNQTQIIARDTTIIKTKKTVLTTINDSTGKLISQSRYSNFKLDGTQISRDQNDSLIKTIYKKGELVSKKTKTDQDQPKNAGSEKKSFKEKMSNFWGKLKFWKKFKKKDQSTESKPKKEKKIQKEPAQPKEKKKRKE